MQTQTPGQTPDRRNPAGSGELPYLPLSRVAGTRLFWLAAFFKDTAHLEALDALYRRSACGIEDRALCSACACLQAKVWTDIEQVTAKGLLPFAWAGTKALAEFEEVVA